MNIIKILNRSIIAMSCVLAFSQIDIRVEAKGLSGQKGNVRGWPATGVCKKIFKRYVTASGHSAYAHTTGQDIQDAVCAISINNRSIGAAEAGALKSCKRGLKRYRNGSSKNCIIYMSK